MGYHVASLIITLMNYEKSEGAAMIIHHICTVYLYGGSYLLNQL